MGFDFAKLKVGGISTWLHFLPTFKSVPAKNSRSFSFYLASRQCMNYCCFGQDRSKLYFREPLLNCEIYLPLAANL